MGASFEWLGKYRIEFSFIHFINKKKLNKRK